MKMLVNRQARTFPGTANQVALARNWVMNYLDDSPVADDVGLIVTEFASNAVIHSLSCVGTFTVRCELFPTYVWVEVEDEGGSWCRSEPDGRAHGLDIVSLLVGHGGWGSEQSTDGRRVVWARLELAR